MSRLKKSASKFQPRRLVVELERILIIYKLQHPLGSGGNNVVVAAVVLETSGFDFLCVLYVLRNMGLDWVWCVKSSRSMIGRRLLDQAQPTMPNENDIFGFVRRSLAGGKCA